MIKVSVIADSLAMPRTDAGETVAWEKTWPIRLDTKLRSSGKHFSFSINSRRARVISTLIGADFYESIDVIEPRIVIIQVGVVDSMPRVFSAREHRIVNHRLFPKGLRSYLIRTRSKKRQSITRSNPLRKVYTKPKHFASILSEFATKLKKRNDACEVIVIPVLINGKVMEEKSPGSVSNVLLYNEILKNAALKNDWRFVDINSDASDLFLKDGYHLNETGHLVISDRLEVLVKEIVNK